MHPAPRYEEPFYWWGPSWQLAEPRPLRDLLRDGTIDPWLGAMLWAALARRRSLAVVAGPSGAGKTTVLTALLELLPPQIRRVYLRGCFESFAFLIDQSIAPAQTVLLANEISPHLPVYLWGPGVRRYLQAGPAGYGLMATAHAESALEFVSLLAGSPLRIPAREIAAFEFVAVVTSPAETGSGRHVSGIWRMQGTRDGVTINPAHEVSSHDISQELIKIPSHPSPFPPRELQRRSLLLQGLRDGSITSLL